MKVSSNDFSRFVKNKCFSSEKQVIFEITFCISRDIYIVDKNSLKSFISAKTPSKTVHLNTRASSSFTASQSWAKFFHSFLCSSMKPNMVWSSRCIAFTSSVNVATFCQIGIPWYLERTGLLHDPARRTSWLWLTCKLLYLSYPRDRWWWIKEERQLCENEHYIHSTFASTSPFFHLWQHIT